MPTHPHQTILDRIESQTMKRSEFVKLRINVAKQMSRAKTDIERDYINDVLVALDSSAPNGAEREFNFMGFCPAGDIKNRLDVKWRSEGICEFFHWDSPDSKTQGEAFRKMLSGDRLILKKTHEFGKTMMLYGFGEVIKRIQTTDDPDDIIYQMRWNPQKHELIVPLMACTRTVNIKRIETVEAAMGKDHAFWDWLEHPYA